MLKVESLSFSYPSAAKPIIQDLNLELQAGGTLFLLGANGVGKTTLLRLIAGLIEPQQGRIYWQDKQKVAVTNTAPYPKLQNSVRVAYLPLNPELLFTGTTVEEEMYINQVFFGPPQKFSTEIFESIGLKRQLESLSTGEKQRLALALTLWKGAEVLLLDEPFVFLSYKQRLEFAKYLFFLQKREKFIIIWATHREEEIHLNKDSNILVLKGAGLWELRSA